MFCSEAAVATPVLLKVIDAVLPADPTPPATFRSTSCTQPFVVAVNAEESNPAIPFVVLPSVDPAVAIL